MEQSVESVLDERHPVCGECGPRYRTWLERFDFDSNKRKLASDVREAKKAKKTRR